MKPLNFDWMLTGCHPLSEVASAYFPEVRTDSASRLLRKQVVFYPALYADLCEAGYTEHTTMLTPLHIAALIRIWGLPGMAREAAETFLKHPE